MSAEISGDHEREVAHPPSASARYKLTSEPRRASTCNLAATPPVAAARETPAASPNFAESWCRLACRRSANFFSKLLFLSGREEYCVINCVWPKIVQIISVCLLPTPPGRARCRVAWARGRSLPSGRLPKDFSEQRQNISPVFRQAGRPSSCRLRDVLARYWGSL